MKHWILIIWKDGRREGTYTYGEPEVLKETVRFLISRSGTWRYIPLSEILGWETQL